MARQVLRDALAAMGVADPQVAAVNRATGHPAWSLALTVPPDDALAHRLTWYLPPQMGLVRIDLVDPELRQPL